LALSVREKTCHAGQVIISEEDKTQVFFVLVSGKVKYSMALVE